MREAYGLSPWGFLIISIKAVPALIVLWKFFSASPEEESPRGGGKCLGIRHCWGEWGREVDYALPLFRMGITYAS